MHPAEGRQADRAPARPPELLVHIAFLAPVTPHPRIETRPRQAAAGEHAQPLHGNLEGLARWVLAAGVAVPAAPHASAPLVLEVGGDAAGQAVLEQGSLDDVQGAGPFVEIGEQGPNGSGLQHDVRIDAHDVLGRRLAEDDVPDAGAGIPGERNIPTVRNPFRQRLQSRRDGTTGIVVENQEIDVIDLGRVQQPDRLNGEVDAVIIVVYRHPYRQSRHLLAALHRRRRSRIPHLKDARPTGRVDHRPAQDRPRCCPRSSWSSDSWPGCPVWSPRSSCS